MGIVNESQLLRFGIRLAQTYTDDRLLHAQASELARQVGLEPNVLISPQIAFAADILERLRSRRLFVKGFVVQAQNMLGHWFDIEGYKNANLGEQRNLFGEVERSFLRERKIGFVFFAGWNEGIKTLADCCTKIGLKASIYAHVKEEEIPFAFDQPLQGMGADATQAFRAKCLDVGKKILISQGVTDDLASERALGYGNRAMLMVSSYNVPTQVLTCLWQEGTYDGVYWQPLLRRRKKE